MKNEIINKNQQTENQTNLAVSHEFLVDTLYEYLTSDHGKDELSLYLSEQTRSYVKVTDVEDDCHIDLMVHDYQAAEYLKSLGESKVLSERMNDFLHKAIWNKGVLPEISCAVDDSSFGALQTYAGTAASE